MVFNETPGGKAKWKLHKYVVFSLEQILGAALLKTTAVRPLTFHLTNHPSKTSNTCWVLLEK